MVTSKKIVRKNKNFVKELEKPPEPSILNIDKIRHLMSDGKWRSVRQIFAGTGISSAGNMARLIDRLLNNGELETGTCEHCDSVTTLYRLTDTE